MIETGLPLHIPATVLIFNMERKEALTRQETSALGTNTMYWVWFDEVQIYFTAST